jgi:hypothetical protein
MLSDKGVQFLPPEPQNPFPLPFYVPSIPRLLESLLDLMEYPRTYMIENPKIYLWHLVQYLFLEMEHQGMKILPEALKHYRPALEQFLDRFKRTDKSLKYWQQGRLINDAWLSEVKKHVYKLRTT